MPAEDEEAQNVVQPFAGTIYIQKKSLCDCPFNLFYIFSEVPEGEEARNVNQANDVNNRPVAGTI